MKKSAELSGVSFHIGSHGELRLRGKVHKHNDFFEGCDITTSFVVKIDLLKMEAETLNTLYTLKNIKFTEKGTIMFAEIQGKVQ